MSVLRSKLGRAVSIAAVGTVLAGCHSVSLEAKGDFSRFVGLTDFSKFTQAQDGAGNVVMMSPPIKARIPWNQLVVSWNAKAPAGAMVKIEASAISHGHHTKYYTMGIWSPDRAFRTSVRRQKDADGTVDTDTLVLTENAEETQLRITLIPSTNGLPTLKFLGASFANTKAEQQDRRPNKSAWGKTIATPEHSQHGYPNEGGWCSPTSLSMALSRWAQVLNRPEMDLTVPVVAGDVFDNSMSGTGNWPFNTAFAGSFDGMRSYVTRLDDLREVEDWIAAGIPVILSARWDWLRPGRPSDAAGHLVVCIGFTEDGDVIINDPAAHPDRGVYVRQTYKRADVMHAWSKSSHAVYLVYPENAKIPGNKYDHWMDR